MTERIEKKLEQITKIEKRIAKWENAKTVEKFWKENKVWCDSWIRQNELYDGTIKTEEDYFNLRYAEYIKECDIEIKRANRDLEEAKNQLEKLQSKETKKSYLDEMIEQMPQCLIDFANQLEETWNKWDLERKEFLNKQRKILSYTEFNKQYGKEYKRYEYKTDEDVINDNKRASQSLIVNLYQRVIDKTGNITDAKGLKISTGNGGYSVLNGVVIGEKGKAVVESIGAGGHNIQRYHIRTLVK